MPATNKKGSVPGSSLSASVQDTTTGQPLSKKRKTVDVKKYYAVRRGLNPGVYETYDECKAQVTGFKGAEHKSFLTREDAEAFVAGKNPTPTDGKKKPQKFYAVASGRKPGVYTNWPDAQEAIGKGNKHKSFLTPAEAEAFVQQYNSRFTSSTINPSANFATEDSGEEEHVRPAKKVKVGSNAAVIAYTDGSALGNGKAGARSGVGVYFGPNDPKNISEPLPGETQTNQRAELRAILRCLETLPPSQAAEIRSDSRYSIQCVTEWFAKWERNGYVTSNGPVQNQDLVKEIRKKLEERESLGTRTQFTWIKGHSGDAGNEAADRLAVAGAQKPR